MAHQAKSRGDYTVAIICALQIEHQAVTVMLDCEHAALPPSPRSQNTNIYPYGELENHNVVICCLPRQYGRGSAATVATNLSRSFPSIKSRLLIGIAGGIPSKNHDVCLGDVVVSMPGATHGGVVQYDLGKQTPTQLMRTGFLSPPPAHLRNAANTMKMQLRLANNNKIVQHIDTVLAKRPHLDEFRRPESEPEASPQIHYGLIASGDAVIKSKTHRDQLREALGDILCVEMEAAGISITYECTVIRGISDLADENKNNDWQGYAAVAAAACAKELLRRVPSAWKTGSTGGGMAQMALEDRQDTPRLGHTHAVQHGGGSQQVGSGNIAISGSGNNLYG
ncbi:nucleoside phosphorylase domain-containing protein [Plectosphaerella plurivora]|uniref:Nucleoside phosphorylase domain-containing protein n=1 Tax=Plectosphaerella plurivora TaxID=936078 RepID=A0A9P9AGT8_9PEZI|nr:nucleoside phosphorylase domain-containing protein [Plectosphaerella plurivora]